MRCVSLGLGLFLVAIACGDPKTPDQVMPADTIKAKPPEPTAKIDPTSCDDDHKCPSGSKCQNGHCVTPPNGGPGCSDFPSPKFVFEKTDMIGEGTATLDRLAGCLTTGGLKTSNVLLVGHCDAKGELEFNMGLGDQRAQLVKDYLVKKGVPDARLTTSSRGKLDATGQDEAGWANDRRVDLEVR
jgi:peptidoglycan-associated lipoprotein